MQKITLMNIRHHFLSESVAESSNSHTCNTLVSSVLQHVVHVKMSSHMKTVASIICNMKQKDPIDRYTASLPQRVSCRNCTGLHMQHSNFIIKATFICENIIKHEARYLQNLKNNAQN